MEACGLRVTGPQLGPCQTQQRLGSHAATLQLQAVDFGRLGVFAFIHQPFSVKFRRG